MIRITVMTISEGIIKRKYSRTFENQKEVDTWLSNQPNSKMFQTYIVDATEISYFERIKESIVISEDSIEVMDLPAMSDIELGLYKQHFEILSAKTRLQLRNYFRNSTLLTEEFSKRSVPKRVGLEIPSRAEELENQVESKTKTEVSVYVPPAKALDMTMVSL